MQYVLSPGNIGSKEVSQLFMLNSCRYKNGLSLLLLPSHKCMLLKENSMILRTSQRPKWWQLETWKSELYMGIKWPLGATLKLSHLCRGNLIAMCWSMDTRMNSVFSNTTANISSTQAVPQELTQPWIAIATQVSFSWRYKETIWLYSTTWSSTTSSKSIE